MGELPGLPNLDIPICFLGPARDVDSDPQVSFGFEEEASAHPTGIDSFLGLEFSDAPQDFVKTIGRKRGHTKEVEKLGHAVTQLQRQAGAARQRPAAQLGSLQPFELRQEVAASLRKNLLVHVIPSFFRICSPNTRIPSVEKRASLTYPRNISRPENPATL